MITLKAVIVEDSRLARNELKELIKAHTEIEVLGEAENVDEGFKLINETKPDLLFLDINMPQLSGISFYKSLQNPLKVIFTTAYSEYALEGFDLDALDYLLKPFSFDRFVKAVSKTKDLKANFKESIVIKSDKKLHQVKIEDILYLESIGDYINCLLYTSPSPRD